MTKSENQAFIHLPSQYCSRAESTYVVLVGKDVYTANTPKLQNTFMHVEFNLFHFFYSMLLQNKFIIAVKPL